MKTSILERFENWCIQYNQNGLSQLREQETFLGYTNAKKLYEQNKPKFIETSKKEYTADQFSTLDLKQTIVGQESQFLNRKTLEVIEESEEKIATLFKECQFIGKIQLFDSTIDVMKSFVEIISSLPSKIIEGLPNVLPPDDFLQLYDSLSYIQQLSLYASACCPNEIANQSFEKLISCTITGDGSKSHPIISCEETGFITKTYINFYTSLLKEVLPNTIYSKTLQTFTAKKGGPPLKVNPQFFFGRSSLTSLYKIIGIKGMIGLDCAAASLVVEMMDKLNDMLSPYLAKAVNLPQGKSVFESNSKQPQEVIVMKHIFSICVILQFRKLLRLAIPKSQEVIEYPYMKNDIAPHYDLILCGRLANSKIQETIVNPGWFQIWKCLWGSEAFAELGYSPEFDAFDNNSHLLPLFTDAIYGTLLRRKAKISIRENEQELVKWAYVGIDEGVKKFTDGHEIIKCIIVPDKLVNIVVK